MARVAVNGIHLNVEVWPSPQGPPSPPGPWLTGPSDPSRGSDGPARLSLTVGEGGTTVEAVASALPSHVQGERIGRDTVEGLPSPAHGRGVGGEGILLLHGFTGGVSVWREHAPVLARHATVVAVDLIGHGHSDAPGDPARYSMARCVADLLAVLDHLGLARVAVLGYSMGARVALHLAAAAPDRVSALILESGSPGLAAEEERRARRDSDEALAARIERDGVERFVDYWEALPLFATQRQAPPAVQIVQRQQRLSNSATGLANSLRGMGTGAQASLWNCLCELHMPTLLIVGALDDKFGAIGRAMAAALPRARLAIVLDAGHTVHLEQPEEFDRLVTDFLHVHWSATEVAWQTTATKVASRHCCGLAE